MYEKRVQKIASALREGEAALFTGEPARRYLTGLSSSAGAVLIFRDSALLLIDFRYFEKAAVTVTSCETVLMKKYYEQLSSLLAERGAHTLYVETSRVTVREFYTLRERLTGVTVSDSPDADALLSRMRAVKSDDELSCIKEAQRLTELAYEHILGFIKPGVTEREIALEIEFFMRSAGSEGVAFDTIALSGENTSLPHGVPGDRRVERGDFVLMDYGAVCGGYCSDMTRTVAVGDASPEQRAVYETVLNAQRAAIEVMREGLRCCDADAAARSVIDDAGYTDSFGHALGHGVGLEIHESPSCNTSNTEPLNAGMIVTAEPGIYLPGRFGVRIENMVQITASGCESLTAVPTELVIL